MKHNRLKTKSDKIFDLTMAGVPTAFFIILFLLPCIAGLFFSLTNFGGYSLKFDFVGLYNYKKLFNDAAFWKSIVNFILLYVGTVVVCFPLAMISAIALVKNKRIRERNFYRILFFFPSTVPMLIIAIMWMTMYNPSFGVLNTMLQAIGLEPVQWLADSKVVMISVIIIVVWRQFGFYLVYFMAAVSNVPKDIYEAAMIDGASEVRQAFSITIPLIWDVVRTSMLFYLQSALMLGFNVIYIVTRGGPDHASEIISSYMFEKMTTELDYGLASAVGVIMLVVTMVMAVLISKLMKRETYEL